MKVHHRPWAVRPPFYAPAGTTGPLLQKYAAADFVKRFLADPRQALKWTTRDRVQQVVPVAVPNDPVTGKPTKLSASKLEPTEIRKLFLATHQRFYLVVCEGVCEAPGSPPVTRADVLQAGFVVRRRRTVLKAEAAVPLILIAVQAQRDLLQVERRIDQILCPPAGGARPLRKALLAGLRKKRAKLQGVLAEKQAALQVIAAGEEASPGLEGWVAGEHKGIGTWRGVPETPDMIEESWFPLYPLIPDPREKDHPATGRTLWFGLVPTGSEDVDGFGAPRFDSRSTYHIRCFVRRRHPECPPDSVGGDVFWSAATTAFQLAAHFDLQGTSNRPTTIEMPDMKELEAAAGAERCQGSLKFLFPAGTAFNFDVNLTTGVPTLAGLAVPPSLPSMSFSIPVVTLVANFVLRLFLPVVMLLFNAWWMLSLTVSGLLPSLRIRQKLDLKYTLPDAELMCADGPHPVAGDLEFEVNGASEVSP